MATQNETLDAEKCSSGDEDHLSTTEVQEVMSYLPGYDGKVVILIGSNTRYRPSEFQQLLLFSC